MSWRGPVAGFVTSQLLGSLWYSPILFGDPWMKIVHPGRRREELGASFGRAMVVSMIAHAALAGALNHIYIDHMMVDSLPAALRAGMAMSGIGALSELSHVMFANKPWALFAIDQGFNTIVVMSMSAGIGFFLTDFCRFFYLVLPHRDNLLKTPSKSSRPVTLY